MLSITTIPVVLNIAYFILNDYLYNDILCITNKSINEN